METQPLQLVDFWCKVVEAHSDFKILPEKSKLIQDGMNTVFLIQTTDTKYFLRASRHYKPLHLTKEDYLVELEVLNHLKKRNVPVAFPVKWKHHSFLLDKVTYQTVDYYCSLFSFADGTSILPLDDPQHYHLGRAVAQIHQHLLETNYTRRKVDIRSKITSSIVQFEKFQGKTLKEELNELLSIKDWLIDQLSHYEGKSPTGLVHGDLHNGNVHFQADNTFTIFDFELLGERFLAYDIACFIGMERWATYVHPIQKKKFATLSFTPFLDGYNSVRPLNDYELEMLPVLEMLRWFGVFGVYAEGIATRGDQLYKGQLLKDFLLKSIKTLMPHLTELKSLFTTRKNHYLDSDWW